MYGHYCNFGGFTLLRLTAYMYRIIDCSIDTNTLGVDCLAESWLKRIWKSSLRWETQLSSTCILKYLRTKKIYFI